jgi:hypothetical protein
VGQFELVFLNVEDRRRQPLIAKPITIKKYKQVAQSKKSFPEYQYQPSMSAPAASSTAPSSPFLVVGPFELAIRRSVLRWGWSPAGDSDYHSNASK